MADRYGTWRITFDRKGVKSTLDLVDLRSEVTEQAKTFAVSHGRVVKVVEAPTK